MSSSAGETDGVLDRAVRKQFAFSLLHSRLARTGHKKLKEKFLPLALPDGYIDGAIGKRRLRLTE